MKEQEKPKVDLPDNITVNLNNDKNWVEKLRDWLIPISIVTTIVSVGIS
nr:hypothetical protein [uncultured Allomuricauda sp.]